MSKNSPTNFRKKRLLLWLLALPVTIIALLALAGFLYGDKAKQMIVDELNSHLLVKVSVGEVNFSVFSNFPSASVVLRNIATQPPDAHPEMPALLNAREISLRFGLFSLFTGNYHVQSVRVDDATINLWLDEKGQNNYQLWKSNGEGSTTSVNFDIQQVHFSAVKFYYRDQLTGANMAIGVPDLTLKGSKQGDVYDLSLNGNLLAERISFQQKEYGFTNEIGVKLNLNINDQLKIGTLTKSLLSVSGVDLSAEGSFGYGGAPFPLEFKLSTLRADVGQLLSLIPHNYTSDLKAYEPAGQLDAEINISGSYDKNQLPGINATFKLRKGSLLHKQSGTRLSGIATNGTFSRGKTKVDQLRLEHFEGSAKNGKFKGRLLLTDLQHPVIDLTLSAKLDLAELSGFVEAGGFERLRGNLTTDMAYKGSTAAGARIAGAARGTILLDGAGFTHKESGRSVSDLNARMELGNGFVYVDDLSLKSGNTDLKIKGRFQNLMEQFFFKDKPLYFDAEIASSNLDLEDLMAFSANNQHPGGNTRLFEPGLSFDVSLNIDHLKYRKFTASEASGKLTLNSQVLKAHNLRFKAMDGSITTTGLMNMRTENQINVICDADFKNVDIKRLFFEFNDFGQSSLKSTHLKGRADIKVNFGSRLDSSFEVDEGSVNALADIEIRNGELTNFEPLQELSRFLNAAELRNVTFSTLKNRIEIARRTVIIPEMEVKSSVMNLKAYGSHTFGNDIDYHLNVLLSELGRKKSRHSAPSESTETDAAGNTRLFLHLTGTVDQPEFRYDSQAVAKKIANDFKNQKHELRDVLREEFGKNKNKPSTKPAKGVKFDIEWDED